MFDSGGNDITLEFDAGDFNNESFNIITSLSEILANDEELNGIEPEEFELDVFRITINSLRTYEKELIKCKS